MTTFVSISQVWEVIRDNHLFPQVVPLSIAVRQNREWFELRLIEDGLINSLHYTAVGWSFNPEGDFFMFGGFAYCKNDDVATALKLAAS